MLDMSPGAVLTGPDSNSQVPSSPDISNLPAASGQAPTMQTPVQGPAAPAQPTATPDMLHHSVLGRAIKSLVGAIHGTETRYQPNSTGGVSEIQTPAKPGAIFRQLLAGALIGGAVGSEPVGSKDDEHRRSVGGFLGGFSRGAAGVAQNAQQRDQAAFERAKQQVTMSQEAQRSSDEHTLHQATAAHLAAQTVSLSHQMHLQDAENIEKHNAAAKAYAQALTDSGAIPGKVSINGGEPTDTAKASDLAAAFVKDPTILKASSPDYVRHFVLTTDPSELRAVTDSSGHVGWQKEDGTPANLADVGSVKILDVPTRTFRTPGMIPGSQINAARGQKIVDDDKTYSLTPQGMSALYTLNLSDANKRSLSAQRDASAKKQTAQASASGGTRVAGSDVTLNGRKYSGRAVDLVEGDMDPSQLSKRSKDYNEKLDEARSYSLAKYGRPFDLARAQSDYKFANNPATQNTLRYLNSLTGSDNKSGNLGELFRLSDTINRTEFPALNNAEAWARLQTGDPQMASYYSAVTEVADQVAKIVQGGGSGSGTSDAKLKQASELFSRGFTKDQIKGVSQTLRTLLANRKTELVGSNRYLLKQFGQATSQPAANQELSVSTHRFSLSAWQQANPGGDTNAAKAAAQKAGYEVVQ